MKNNVREKKKPARKNHLLIKLLLLVALLIGLFFADKLFNYFASVKETSKTENKKLPVGFADKLSVSPAQIYKVPIIMYHYVEYVQDTKDVTRMSLNINPNIFEAQIKTLKDGGYTFMTAKELAEVLNNKKPLPQKPVLITIDDGHWDVDTVILPILKKYHAKATVYVISGFTGGSDFLSDRQLNELVESGLVEIGAHTVHHISLKGKLDAVVKYEINQSKKDLEKELGINIVSFAYPDGVFDEQAIREVQNAGFSSAVSTVPGINQSNQNRYFLFRLRPGYRVGAELIDYFNQNKFRNW